MEERGLASPVGLILIVGLSLAVITVVVATGAALVDEQKNEAETAQMENSMSQFSSKASLVGLGDSSNQRFSLGRASSGDVLVDEEAGQVAVLIEPQGGTREEIYNESYGAVIYRNGDAEVAYQGGGVWRKQGDSSRMVSPPEYHYRSLTLTYPIIRVAGDGGASGRPTGTISSATVDEAIYPNATDDTRNNPLEDGAVFVKVESRYCEGWEAFFEERSAGGLEQRCDEDDPQTVVVDLTVPFDLSFNEPIAANQIVVNGNEDPPFGSAEGMNPPSASEHVQDEIDGCGGCPGISTNGVIDDGTYFTDDDIEFEDVELDTTDGDITLVVDGDIRGADDITVTGDGNVTLYLKGKFEMGGGDRINTGGDASQFITIIHSDSDEIDFNGNFQYTGAIYAPEVDANMNGGGNPDKNFVGSLVANDVDINGNPNNFEYDPELMEYELPIPADVSPITYLHVTGNTVEVEVRG